MAEIDPDFYNAKAMINEAWKGPSRMNRHVITRLAIHYITCRPVDFHLPEAICIVQCAPSTMRRTALEYHCWTISLIRYADLNNVFFLVCILRQYN